MSTRVQPEDYPTLTEVPRENWLVHGVNGVSGRPSPQLGPCDIEPSHGRAQMFMQTPDHRAIALCGACLQKVLSYGSA